MNTASDLELCNCFASRQAARYLTKMYERHLAGVHLTSTQFSILVMLGERQGMTMREMSSTMVMDRTSLVRALKPMQRDQLVLSGADETDSRQNLFTLSEQGRARLQQAVPLWMQAQGEFESRFGKEEAARIREVSFRLGRGA